VKSALLKLPDTDSRAPMSALRECAAGIVIRASSLSRAWDIDNRLSAKTNDSQAIGTADYQYDVLGRASPKTAAAAMNAVIESLKNFIMEHCDKT